MGTSRFDWGHLEDHPPPALSPREGDNRLDLVKSWNSKGKDAESEKSAEYKSLLDDREKYMGARADAIKSFAKDSWLVRRLDQLIDNANKQIQHIRRQGHPDKYWIVPARRLVCGFGRRILARRSLSKTK